MTTASCLHSVRVPAKESSAAVARGYVRGLVAGRPDADEIALLVSELFTNAVKHSDSGRRADGVVKLVVMERACALRVEVTDEGPSSTIPQIPAQVDLLSESGRGLWFVREVSSAWGWRNEGACRVVWFEVAR
jgi:anti-sigma regulatory factor (Ser/Thr protein kinase)